MRSVVVLDRGHGDRGTRPFDPGATSGALRETDLADAYLATAAEVLRAHGHEVVLLGVGPYVARHRRAVELAQGTRAPVAYIQAHVNAGRGAYGLVEFDARSRGGSRLADHLAAALRPLPGLTKAVTRGLGAKDRGFVCVSGIYAGPANLSAALYEPGFVDYGPHAELLWTPQGLRRIGEALAAGVEAWGAERAAA